MAPEDVLSSHFATSMYSTRVEEVTADYLLSYLLLPFVLAKILIPAASISSLSLYDMMRQHLVQCLIGKQSTEHVPSSHSD